MRVTAILNLKGGVAKTVTTANMAAILAHDHHKSVLVVDADSQANLTEFFRRGEAQRLHAGGYAAADGRESAGAGHDL